MKQLKFRQHLADLIVAGSKTATWRLFDDKDLQVGDQLELLVSETQQPFATAIITAVTEKPLKQITAADFVGHEPFESREVMLQTYKTYYGDAVSW